MNFGTKYDVAISVAEEDKEIARLITNALKKRGISCYYYDGEEEKARSWGKHILEVLLNVYGSQANYILLITGKVYAEKYWATTERQISEIFRKRGNSKLLQLRIDDTPIDGLSKHIVSKEWINNPEEIAGIIAKRLKSDGRKRRKEIFFLVVMVALLFLLYSTGNRSNTVADNNKTLQADTVPSDKQKTISKEDLPDRKGEANKPEKALVKAGMFTMGNNSGQSDEQPPHVVKISAFYMSRTEVTVAQFAVYCKSKGKALPPQYSHRFLNSCPVVNISWNEAVAYCKSVGGRLPTEAEWEYAAGAGELNKYSGSNDAGKVGIYNKGKPSQVATKSPNIFGLYDMTGNVAEWCADWYDPDYYSQKENDNPQGPLAGKEKVIRGGAYGSVINPVNQLRITVRSKASPDSGRIDIGFRVAWDK